MGSIPTAPAMAVVAKWLTHRIVAPTLGGSIPLVRPYIGVSPSGKATDFDSVMRWFESSYPSLMIIMLVVIV